MEAFHPYDGKEVICEHEDDHGGDQARVEDDGSAEHVPESALHAEEGQQSEMHVSRALCHKFFMYFSTAEDEG